MILQNYEMFKLEDGQNYIVVNKMNHNGVKYLLLSEENNSRNICIRKVEKENYLSLLSEEEFDQVINLFNKSE